MNKSNNFSRQPVIGQVLKFITRPLIARTAKAHTSDRYYKRFKTYGHFVTMIFATSGGFNLQSRPSSYGF